MYLRDLEPAPVETRPTKNKGIGAAEDAQMLAFQLIGLALLALFFGALIGNDSTIRH